jgi:hypothetical protein
MTVVKTVYNVRVGKPDVKPTATSHVRGVYEGNARGHMIKEGLVPMGEGARGNARRSTGIDPDRHEVIDPRMPKLSPA